MAWRDQLRDGSFRGVPFKIDGHDYEIGRRIEVHEFPQRDDPFPEDLGRRARRYAVDCFVIGASYMEARDALARAIEEKGPGTLVHPYLGTLQVTCEAARISETAAEGGMATFSVQFIEAGAEGGPRATKDTRSQVSRTASSAAERVASGFPSQLNLDGAAGFVAPALAEVLRGLAGQNTSANVALVSPGAGATASSAAVDQAVQTISIDSGRLVREPADLAGSLLNLAGLVRAAAPTPAAAVERLVGMADAARQAPQVEGSTPARVRQRAAQGALTRLFEQAALIEAARASAEVDFTSYDDAATLRDDLSDRIDLSAVEAGDAGDDVAFAALSDVRVDMLQDLTARGATLARLTLYTPASTIPAVVIAHALFGDAGREAELVDRNRIRHAGFVPAGRPLQVLIDG